MPQIHQYVYSRGTWLAENLCVDVGHQVPSSHVVHDKADVLRSLKTAEEAEQEWMGGATHSHKHTLLTQEAVEIKG